MMMMMVMMTLFEQFHSFAVLRKQSNYYIQVSLDRNNYYYTLVRIANSTNVALKVAHICICIFKYGY